MSLWPPGSERKRLTEIPRGTEIARGTSILVLEDWKVISGGTTYLVYWRGLAEPAVFQGEPTLTVWPANQVPQEG
jgi:hypothetical protein